MAIDHLFEKLDELDPESLVVDALDALLADLGTSSDYEGSAARSSIETAKWSLRQNPGLAAKYCRDLEWEPADLAAMMLMQCAIASLTSGEFLSTRGVLSPQGEGFRHVWKRCLTALLESGCISQQIADIETRELDAEIAETVPVIASA